MKKDAYLCYSCREAIKSNVNIMQLPNPEPDDKHKCSICGKKVYADYYRLTFRKA